MLTSMTGYGRASAEADGRVMVIELKCVNHRYLDIAVRLPRFLLFLEEPIRAQLAKSFERGHVDVFANYQNTRDDAREVVLNQGLLSTYLQTGKAAAQLAGMQDDTRLYEWLRMPDVLTVQEVQEDQDALGALCKRALGGAIDEVRAMRQSEGMRMESDLRSRMESLAGILKKIGERAPLVVEEHREKLRQRVTDLLDQGVRLDEGKLENEVAFFADRACIDEELVRFDSHLMQMDAIMRTPGALGRKLDFLVQELNREMNTIGSKANDGEISRLVVDGKAEIEKIREQVQNIE